MSRREEIAPLPAEGLTRKEIARRLGLTPSTVAYHVRKLGFPAGPSRRRYDWSEVQAYCDEGHSVRECAAYFGFSTWSAHHAVSRGVLVARPRAMPVDHLTAAPRSRHHLKRRMIRAGLLRPLCARCGIDTWLGAPLSLALHRVNGDGQDNRLESLQLLCPQRPQPDGELRGAESEDRGRRAARGGPAALNIPANNR